MTQPPPNSYVLPISDLDSKLTLSSRWEYLENGAVWSAWAGSSIKFRTQHALSSLFIKLGHRTQRKDRWNGGTPMFAVSVTKPESQAAETKTFDAEPGMVLQLWDEPIQECLVEITLTDWASILEIEAFISPYEGHIDRHPKADTDQILFIGDSITCGLALERSDGGQPIPNGILDAFPSQAILILRDEHSYPLSLDIVAYPGISLVGLDSQDDDNPTSHAVLGMADRFFRTSPWETTPWSPRGSPRFVCIALGSNDEANDVAPELFRSTLERFILRLSATFPSIKVFYVIPPFRDLNEPDSGAIHASLVSTPLRVVIDNVDVRICENIGCGLAAEHTVDGLHPTLMGHRLLAQNLAHYLKMQRPPPELAGWRCAVWLQYCIWGIHLGEEYNKVSGSSSMSFDIENSVSADSQHMAQLLVTWQT